ncbi:MAG: hypothetical protein JXA68_08180 [Ignavibacteriales bacterium]|nr:hypothetical protein [Ignavibacteriales bacterium]
MISLSINPEGNPVAKENPDMFALRYGRCRVCHHVFCESCLIDNGNRCLNCDRPVIIEGPIESIRTDDLEELSTEEPKERLERSKRRLKQLKEQKKIVENMRDEEKKAKEKPTVDYFSFSGLDAINDDPNKIFSGLMKFLLPSVSELLRRNINKVRSEINDPVISGRSKVQGECIYNESEKSYEILLHEGLFLLLRCFSEVLSTQLAVPSEDMSIVDMLSGASEISVDEERSLPRNEAIDMLEGILERFWQKPDNPLGLMEFIDKAQLFKSDNIQPVADILCSLITPLENAKRKEFSQTLVYSSSLYILAHELGHYMVKNKMNNEQMTLWADAVRQIGFGVPDSMDKEWAVHWAEEFQADMEAVNVLLHFGERLAGNKIEEIKLPGDFDSSLISFTVANYYSIFFTLGCLHLLEVYGWVRFKVPYLVSSHPPALRRREFIVRTIPPSAIIPLTAFGELIWCEMETMFSELLKELDKKKKIALDGKEKQEVLNYFAESKKRFKENYGEARIVKEVKNLLNNLK